MIGLLLLGVFCLVVAYPIEARYYNLGSHRVVTWNVDYGNYYYNDLQLKIRLRNSANLVAFTWKNTGNCRNQYFLNNLNGISVNIPYSNSLVVHPWNGYGSVDVDARNEYCVGLYCYGDNTCNIEYDYYANDGCWDYTVRCSRDGALDTTRDMFTCGRYHGCGCGWNTVWKCNQCWYGPCNCGYHVVQCDCYPTCPTNNKRDLTYENSTVLIQNVMEEDLLNMNNYLIDKNISIDNCFQNNVQVYNKTYDEILSLEKENRVTQNEVNVLDVENKKLSTYLIVFIVLFVLTLLFSLVMATLMGVYLYKQYK